MKDDFCIIDAHVHTYPSAEIGRQALDNWGYGYSGTIEELKRVMLKAKISQAVMANLTPLQEMIKANIDRLPEDLSADARRKAISEINQKMIARMERRNAWTCQMANENPNLAALISVDILQSPDEMVEEVESKVTSFNAKGIKLHPIVNQYFPWDERMSPVYSKAEELKIPVLFHSGKSELPGYDSKFGLPREFEKMAKAFPDLTIVLAHLGKGFYEESVRVAKECPNIYFDTATCFFGPESPGPKDVERIFQSIKEIGANRVMFGTDWPWFDPEKDIEIIKQMDLGDEEKSKILGLNAKEVYRL